MNELYFKLNHLIDRAFYRIYRRTEDQYIIIDHIGIDYSTCENSKDAPFIEVEVRYNTRSEGYHYCTLEYSPEESDDFNEGVFYATLSSEMWEEWNVND